MQTIDARIPTRFRLALTFVCVFTLSVLVADWIGLVPNERMQLLRSRNSLSESLAVSASAIIANGDTKDGAAKDIESAVAAFVASNDSVVSVRLIDSAREIRFETDGHQADWSNDPSNIDSNITIPVRRYGQRWGTLQVAYADPQTEITWARDGVWGLLAFAIPLCLLLFSFLLGTRVDVSLDETATNDQPPALDQQPATMPFATQDSATQDDELRAVVANFLKRFETELEEMEQAVRESNIRAFAKDDETQIALGILDEMQSIRSRIVTPVIATPADDDCESEPNDLPDRSPIECLLPMDDEDYREIVLDFIERFDIRLMKMLSLVQNRSFEDLQNEAHWLKGAGGTVGFPALTEPAMGLMNASRRGEVEACQESLRDILVVRQRFVLPHAAGPTAPGPTSL